MTLYQLEILNPVSGQWLPVPISPARNFTTAMLHGLRLYPDSDLQVVQVEVPDEVSETDDMTPGVRRVVIDGQVAIVGGNLNDERIRQEISERRSREKAFEKEENAR